MKPSFSEHLTNLLYRNDCVILPGFGGFLTERKPATIHPVSHRFSPPGKKVIFNPRLKTNDGLLTTEMSIAMEVPYRQAFDQLMKEIEEMKAALAKGKNVDLAPLGKLMMGFEQQIVFEEDLDQNLLLDSYGLTEFRSSFIVRSETAAVQESISKAAEKSAPTEKELFNRKEEEKKQRWWVAAAAAALLIGFGTWNFAYQEKAQEFYKNYAYLIPWVAVPEAQYQSGENIEKIGLDESLTYPVEVSENIETVSEAEVLEIEPELIESQVSEGNSFSGIAPILDEGQGKSLETKKDEPKPEAVKPEVKAVKTKVKAEIPAPSSSEQAKYLIISGCFSEPANADKQSKILEKLGYTSTVRFTGSKSKLNYVAYAGYENKSEALKALRNIRASHSKDAWLYIR